ncbi:MAG: alpha-amlyase [Kangiellaceae bacterium]|nr:alpha-amlyase [Kangiellaceae bacterium]|tara:strand:- start:2508 stop:4334 length:1827 start_codon:yes stop_codon:yes gene_type:complete
MKYAVCALALAISGAATAATEQDQSSSAVLLQGFHWHSHASDWYNTIQNNASSVSNLGATHVWFPPASDAASDEGYLPRQLNNLNSKYGTGAQLSAAIGALSANGVKSIADIVVNHRVGSTNWADFTNPTWGSWAVTADDEWGQGTGAWDSGDPYGAARDLDHTNQTVRNDIVDWINNTLKGVGFSGLRFDYSKGYAPGYAGEYADRTNVDFCVGEVWTDLNYNDVDSHRQKLMDFVSGTNGSCGAFDFTTKGLLNQALSFNEYWRLANNGAPAGGIGWWPQKMVTFVDNHDTGPSESCGNGQNHWSVPCDKVMQGYAYILTHPGIPTVYWAHVYDWGLYDAVKAIIDVRKAEGITSTSSVDIQAAESDKYAAIIDGKVAVKIGSGAWSPGAGWTVKASGNGYAVWSKDSGCTSGCGEEDWQRTVIFVYGTTESGQDMFIRGGLDHNYAAANLGKNCTSSNYECAIPIRHNNMINATTVPWKANEQYLDWYGVESGQSSAAEGTPADWTVDTWPSDWGATRTVAADGFGEEPLNLWGAHYWMLDVEMDCNRTANGWFELKTYISNGPGWEADVSQPDAPYASGNHFAECGKINVFRRSEGNPVSIHSF